VSPRKVSQSHRSESGPYAKIEGHRRSAALQIADDGHGEPKSSRWAMDFHRGGRESAISSCLTSSARQGEGERQRLCSQ
jgi:hypothetical protein